MKQLVAWRQTKGRPKRGRRQPCVELLESRRLLSSITEYPVALVNGKNTSPSEVTVGPNGTLWFIESGGNAIWSLSTTNPNPTPTPYPGSLPSGSLPMGITLGPDGNTIWFTELAANQIGMINPNDASHTIRNFGTSDGMTARSGPAGITSADGYLWFTQNQTHQIGRLDPSTGKITEYSAPVAMTTLNSRIVLGPDGNLWFTEFGAIGIFNPNTGKVVKEVALASSSEEPFGLAVGPDGNIWYTEGVVNSAFTGYVSFGVGVISTDTKSLIKEIPVTASSEPFGITAGPDGNLWFAVTGANKVAGTIDVINPSTVSIIRALAIPTNGVSTPDPVAITAGPDGNIWFSDGTGAIGVVADTRLVATAQPPSDLSINSPFGITVTIEYTSGVVNEAFSGNVTIALANNPGGSRSALGGTVMVAAVNGVANFSGLRLNIAGDGYTLRISGGGLSPVMTNPFDVKSIILSSSPPTNTGGQAASLPPSPPTITGEHVVFNQKRNKKGKPIGKPTLAGFTIDFSTAMKQGTIGAPGNYVVEMVVLKKQAKRKRVEVAQPIGFSVTNVTTQSVSLTLAGKQKFPKGGKLTVIASPPGGVESTSGVFLAANGVFTILPGGNAIALS